MSPERPREQELSRLPAGQLGNPCELGSGFHSKHETESELPPGANDYETTALSASPIVRDICHIFSIG